MTKVSGDSPVTPITGDPIVDGIVGLGKTIAKGVSGSKYDDDIQKHSDAAKSTQPHLTDPSLEPSVAVLKDCSTALSSMGSIGDALIEIAAATLKERKEDKNHGIASTMNAYHKRMIAADKNDKAADKRLVATCVEAGADIIGRAVDVGAQGKLARSNLSESKIHAYSQMSSSASGIAGDLGRMAGAGFTNAADHLDNDAKRDQADAGREDTMAENAAKSADEIAQLLQSVISQLNQMTEQAYNTDRDQIRPA